MTFTFDVSSINLHDLRLKYSDVRFFNDVSIHIIMQAFCIQDGGWRDSGGGDIP